MGSGARQTASGAFAPVQIYLFAWFLGRPKHSKSVEKAFKDEFVWQIAENAILNDPPMKNHVFYVCRDSTIRPRGIILGDQNALVMGVRFRHAFRPLVSHARSK